MKCYLDNKGSQEDGAEDGIPENPIKDVPLSVNLACVEFVEDLHEDKRVEDDGVMLRGRGVQGGVSAVVDVEHLLTCEMETKCLQLVLHHPPLKTNRQSCFYPCPSVFIFL